MRKIMVISIAAVLAYSGAAFAETARGKIKSVDTENNVVVLKNLFSFHYGDDVNESDLAVGDYVKINYKKNKGIFEATKVEVTKKKS